MSATGDQTNSRTMWGDGKDAIPHGFPNLRVIQRSIADLHKRFPGSQLLGLEFPSSLSRAIVDVAKIENTVDSVQHIVGAIVHHFHLRAASVVVRINGEMEEPARIRQIKGGDRIVEIQPGFMGGEETVALLAHEIAHFFLDTAQIHYENRFENEVLTDTTACYLGAGWSILNAYRRSVSKSSRVVGINAWETTTTTRESKLGYLTPEEFGYVLARRSDITREYLLPWIGRSEGKYALSLGMRQLRRELAQPPLTSAGTFRRLGYKYAVLRSKKCSGQDAKIYNYGVYSIEAAERKCVLFRCPRCTQQLRLPVGVKRAEVTCKNCKHVFECSS